MNSLFKSFVSGKKTDDGDKSTSTPTSATSATPGRSAIDVLRGCDANAEQSGSGKGDDEFNRWLAHANRNLFVDDNVSAVRVARAFEFGEYGVKVDLKKAMFFYKRAINEMSGVEAINEHPTPLSSKLLADAFSAALKRGSKSNATVDDLQRLAYCYHVGQGTAVDIQKACEIYRRILAIDPKILQTLVNLSSAVPKLPESDYVESFELRKRAAELDSPTSMVGVARCLQNGCGVEKDAVAALEWLYRAAFKGYVPAITSLWLAMRDGVGVAKSDAAAFPWCKRAAEAGDPQSCVQLGRYYRAGIGGEQNDAEAARLFYQAAIDGDPDGALDLGRCFEGGHGVEKDVDEAVGWYAIAAVSSPDASNAWSALARVPVPPSQVLVALEVASANKSLKRIHSTAHTLAKVALRAATLDENRRAVEFARLSGDADCICNIACWLCQSNDFELALELSAPFLDDPSDFARGNALYVRTLESQSRDDYAAAGAWCRKAADAGTLLAMAAHARNLFSGLDGVDRDVASSIEWNEKAVRRGHRPAGVHLAVQIRLGVLPGEPDHGRAAKLLSDALGTDQSTVAQFFLGCALLDGLGIERDQARGTEMIAGVLRCGPFAAYSRDCFDALSSATPSGIPWESSALLHGLLAESGFGRVRNVEAARRCYLEAIEQAVDVSDATHAMARLAVLAHGAGDNAQAVDWLHKALAGAQPPSASVLAAVQELRDVIALDERLQALCGDDAVVSRVEIEQAATFADDAFVFESESDVQPSTAANEVNEEDATFAALTRLEVYDDGDLMSEIDVPDFDDFSDDADEDEEKTSSKQKKKVKVKVKVPS